MLVDSHCHLNFPEFDEDLKQVLERAAQNNLCAMLAISTSLDEFASVIKVSALSDNIFVSVGVHPCNVNARQVVTSTQIQALCASPKVIGIGETGLDYYHSSEHKHDQLESFIQHIKAAQDNNLPLIVHTRDAGLDTLNIMEKELKIKGFHAVIHCFTESMDFAIKAIELGFYISFSGIVTFKNAKALQDIARVIPLNRILVETDAPYLAPVPHRGKRNEPSYVIHTAKFLADLRNLNYNEFCEVTTNNFYNLFSKAVR